MSQSSNSTTKTTAASLQSNVFKMQKFGFLQEANKPGMRETLIEVGFVYYFILARFYDIDPLMQEREGWSPRQQMYRNSPQNGIVVTKIFSFSDLAISFEQEKAFRYYKKNSMSVELLKDDYLQKVHFRVKNKVRHLTLSDFVNSVWTLSLLSLVFHVSFYTERSQRRSERETEVERGQILTQQQDQGPDDVVQGYPQRYLLPEAHPVQLDLCISDKALVILFFRRNA